MKNILLDECLDEYIEPLPEDLPEHFPGMNPENFPNANPEHFPYMGKFLEKLITEEKNSVKGILKIISELEEMRNGLNHETPSKSKNKIYKTPKKCPPITKEIENLIRHDYNTLINVQKRILNSKPKKSQISEEYEKEINRYEKEIELYGTENRIYEILKQIHGYDDATLRRVVKN